MIRAPLSRRMLLRGAGGVALGLPLLEAMGSRAWAAPPKRLLVFYHHQGTYLDRWRPKEVGTGFAMSDILAPLTPFRSQVTVLSGLNNVAYDTINIAGDAHGNAYVSAMTANTSVNPADKKTGSAGPSIDHELGRRIQGGARFRVLNLVVGLRGKPVFWSGRGQAADRENDPRRAWTRLFGSGTPTVTPTPTMPAAPSRRERLLAQRKPIVDAVMESYRELSAKVGAADREILERHINTVAEVEKAQAALPAPGSMPTTPTAGCRAPAQEVGASVDIEDRELEPQMSRAQINNAVMALACDQTRVATLLYAHEDRQNFNWLKLGLPGPYDNWHVVVHQKGGSKREEFVRALTWYTEQFAYLIQQMANVRDGAGSLLDNTLILWMSDFGNGASHQPRDLPVVLAGGGLKGGRHLAFPGRTTNELYTTVLNTFGFDDKTFGLTDSAFNRGPLPLG